MRLGPKKIRKPQKKKLPGRNQGYIGKTIRAWKKRIGLGR